MVVILDFVLIGVEDNFSVGLFDGRWVSLIEVALELVEGNESALFERGWFEEQVAGKGEEEKQNESKVGVHGRW